MVENSNALERLAEYYIKEQKRKRIWSIIFKLTVLVLLSAIIVASHFTVVEPLARDKAHVGLIDITGIIQERSSGSADNIADALHNAFYSKGLKGIILRINSPGGSPVQADYIFSEIRRWRKKKPEVPIYAVCTDMCASAAYYIASAADDVYANPASIVGSIGVIYNGFGVTDLMTKVGVESRIQTSGKRKSIMNPFQPETAADRAHLQTMLNTVHERFIERVKEGRGKRIGTDPDIYSGLFWSGKKAKELGLIDDFASAGMIVRKAFNDARIIDYTEKPNLVDKLAKQLGAQAMRGVQSVLPMPGMK
jgi:protease-4